MTIRAIKEIIWHLTCNNCKYTWSYPTMEDKFCIERGNMHCPQCGRKETVAVYNKD